MLIQELVIQAIKLAVTAYFKEIRPSGSSTRRLSSIEYNNQLSRLGQGRLVAKESPDAMLNQQLGSIAQAKA